jgi:hypothetical protein
MFLLAMSLIEGVSTFLIFRGRAGRRFEGDFVNWIFGGVRKECVLIRKAGLEAGLGFTY